MIATTVRATVASLVFATAAFAQTAAAPAAADSAAPAATQPNRGSSTPIPEGATTEEEVARRRKVAKSVVAILTESDKLSGDERANFVREKFEELEQSVRG